MFIASLYSKESIVFGRNNYVTEPKTKPYPNDTVELSGVNKGVNNEVSDKKETNNKNVLNKNKPKEMALVASFSLFSACAFSLFFAKKQKNKILKLYKEKLTISNLPSKLEFNEFTTIENAVKYAKNVLGIERIDSNFTLEALNTTIRGLIDVSNANKGRVFMPKRLGFESLKENSLAQVIRDINSSKFGDMVINKDYFNETKLNKELDIALFYKDGEKIYDIDAITGDIQSSWKVGSVYPFPQEEVQKLIQKYYTDKNSVSIMDKQKLFYSLDYGLMIAKNYQRNPLEVLKLISKEKSEFLKENNINLNFEELKNMTVDKQTKYLEDLVKKLEDKGSYVEIWYGLESPSYIIHHEMGHLQDYAKNLKELDIMQYELNWKDLWNYAANNGKSRIRVHEVSNRWGSVRKSKYSKILKENPQKFKRMYPDLYEFVKNPDIQQTAGKVSTYAQSGIGEFIAETFTRMIAKRPIPDDVIALYKKYKGPELPV